MKIAGVIARYLLGLMFTIFGLNDWGVFRGGLGASSGRASSKGPTH